MSPSQRKRDARNLPAPDWRELLTSWRLWLLIVLCLLVATLAWLLGYD
ncbi:MAG TPA: hypothetical protein VKB72_08660 [Steroidobacteraceae bacterium]|nr:hypothetical protein [Steroidobacteraceae bacterium]